MAPSKSLTFSLNNAARFFKDSCDDDPPAMKKYKTVKSCFPKIMPPEDEDWRIPKRVSTMTSPRVHYVSIEKEGCFPSTSKLNDRIRPSGHSSPISEPKPTYFRTATSSLGKSSIKHENSSFLNAAPFSQKNIESIDLIRPSSRLLEESSFNKLFREDSLSNSIVNRTKKLKQPVINIDDEDDDDDDDCVEYIPIAESSKQSLNNINSHSLSNDTKCEDDDDDAVEISDEYDVVLVKREPPTAKILDTSRKKYRYPRMQYFSDYSKLPLYKLCKSKASSPSRMRLTNRSRCCKTPEGIYKPKVYARRSVQSIYSDRARAALESFRLDEKKSFEELIQRTKSALSPSSFFARKVHENLSTSKLMEKSSQPVTLNTECIDLTESCYAKYEKLTNGDITKSKISNNVDKVLPKKLQTESSDQEEVNSAENSSNASIISSQFPNKLKLLYQHKPVFQSQWLESLNRKYSEISLHKENEVVKIVEEEEIPVLPELTAEQESKIDGALRAHPANEVLIEKFSLSIHRRDIQTLSGLNWLNDEVINFYMNLIMERSQKKENLPKVYGMNTFFFPRLMQTGHSGLKRWTRKVDIFSHDFMLVPVHLGVHWCMSIIDFKNKNIKYYDSMGGKNMDCCTALLKYLEDEKMDKKNEKFDSSSWQLECVKDIPHQMNGSDCGMFSCMFAEYISRNARITFSQDDMPYFRRKMILEIIQGQLIV